MKLEVGKFYKTRDGKKVEILKTDVKSKDYPVIGILLEIDGSEIVKTYTHSGENLINSTTIYDIVSEWQEPLDFDWSCLPAWCNKYIIMNRSGNWYSYPYKPFFAEDSNVWCCDNGVTIKIPKQYRPKNFTGDCKDSLFENPNLK